MMQLLNYKILMIFNILFHQVLAANYEIFVDDSHFVEACNEEEIEEGNVNINELFDFSNLKRTPSDDWDTIYTNGDVVVIGDIPKDIPLRIRLELLRNERGQWVDTMITIKRDDFCRVAFRPIEPWYIMMMNLPKEQRVCPPTKGMIYNMRNTSNKIYFKNMPASNMDGHYKAIIRFKAGNLSTCFTSQVHVYKK